MVVVLLKPGRFYGRDVLIVQFPRRNGFIAGDVAANDLIKEALREVGLNVSVFSVQKARNRSNIAKWLFEEKWDYYCAIRKEITKRNIILIIDGQLNIGFLPNRCINIFHFSQSGYRRLAGKTWTLEGKLGSVASSMIESLGAARSTNIAVSSFQRRFLEHERIKIDRLIPNAVDTQLFRPRPGRKERDFVFLGAFNYWGKGFDVLEQLAQLGLSIDCITNQKGGGLLNYKKDVPHEEVPGVLSLYKVLILPSRYESCSMVVLEAMSSGLPVLISKVGIGPELQKYVPEFVISGYGKEAVIEYFEKANLILDGYEFFSRKAREYVENRHSLDRFKNDWRSIFSDS